MIRDVSGLPRLFLAALLLLGPSNAAHAVLYHEAFDTVNQQTGLPDGWSVGPPAHVPYIHTARDESVFALAPPALRVDVPPLTMNYQILTPRVHLDRLDAPLTLSLRLRVEMPDSPFLIEVVTLTPDGRWITKQRLLTLLGGSGEELRLCHLPFVPGEGDQPGFCFFLLGLPYMKAFRAGRFWVDDFEVTEGGDPRPLSLYVTPTNVEAGGSIDVHISSRRESAIVQVRREAERAIPVGAPMPIEGLAVRPVHDRAYERGCGWPVDATIPVPSDWPSGLYRIDVEDGEATATAFFVVRGRGGEGRVLVVLPTHTEQAYNDWGGRSFYSNVSSPVVSFERPIAPEILRAYAGPIHLLRWLAREGIGYAVADDDDLHDRPELLLRYPAVALAGHDEYWTLSMRRAVEEYTEAGGALISLSGNTCWWQTRIEEDADGRRLVCYKYAADADPYHAIDPSLVTTRWDEAPVENTEARFLGLSWRYGGMVNFATSSLCPCPYDWLLGHGGYQVFRTDHWVFAGTGLAEGSMLGREAAIVGYEVDGAPLTWTEGRPSIAAGAQGLPGFVVLGTAPCQNLLDPDSTGDAVMGIWERSESSFVFNGGTTGWCFGMGGDPAVQRIVRNLLERATGSPAPAPRRLAVSIAPNPARDGIALEVRGGLLPEGAEVFAADGRRVATVKVSPLSTGRSRGWWMFRDEQDQPLPAGVYFLRVLGGPSTRIVHLR